MVKKGTSLKIESEIWKSAKMVCVEKEITMSDYVEKLLLEDIEKNSDIIFSHQTPNS